MQEFELPVRKTLTQGLRPRSDTGRNKDFLAQCQYMKPLSVGLRSCADCVNPFADSLFYEWPFPQLIRTASETLLIYADEVYPVIEYTDQAWVVGGKYTTYDLNDPAVKLSIIKDGVWHCADLGAGWLLFNGTSVVFKLGTETMFDEEAIVYVQDSVSVLTGCASRGRLLLGGFTPSALFSGVWQAVWGKYLSSLPYSISTDLGAIGANYVYWSTIGGGDVLLPFAAELAKDGLIKEDKPDEYDEEFFLELFKRNELGFMPMPWQGSVLCVKPLGKGVAVYGTDGIAVLIPALEPYPTYGLQRVADFGIASRGAVGGDERGHILVDIIGNAWSLGADYSLQKLGYKEYIGTLLDSDIVILKNAEYEEFFISGSSASFVLTPQGLGETPQQITGACNVEGSFYGVFNTPKKTDAIIVTDNIDFNYRDLKTITTVEVGCNAEALVYVAIDYKYDKQNTWQRSPWVLVNSEGFARVQITALDFRIAVKCDSYKGFELDYINVRWQTAGRRTVRGLSANTANT